VEGINLNMFRILLLSLSTEALNRNSNLGTPTGVLITTVPRPMTGETENCVKRLLHCYTTYLRLFEVANVKIVKIHKSAGKQEIIIHVLLVKVKVVPVLK
jgi:hypothetical protein